MAAYVHIANTVAVYKHAYRSVVLFCKRIAFRKTYRSNRTGKCYSELIGQYRPWQVWPCNFDIASNACT